MIRRTRGNFKRSNATTRSGPSWPNSKPDLIPPRPEPQHKRPKLRLIQGGKAGLLAPWLALVDHAREHVVATATVACVVATSAVAMPVELDVPRPPVPMHDTASTPGVSVIEESRGASVDTPPSAGRRISAIRPRSVAAQAPPETGSANPIGAAPLANVVGPLASENPHHDSASGGTDFASSRTATRTRSTAC